MKINSLLILSLAIISTSASEAQFVEDALRLTTSNAVITPRVAGLGISYLGLADDIGALYFNPAGMVNIKRAEVSVGLGFTRNNSETDYLNNVTDFTSSSGYISNIGVIAPFNTSSKGAAIGIGYFLENDYDYNLEYSAFNTQSTYIADEAAYGPYNLKSNWAAFLGLADNNLKTDLLNSLSQLSFVQQSGGMHNIVGGAAFNLNNNISVGFSISGKFGTYEYLRNYEEVDDRNIYNGGSNIDFRRLDVEENLSQDISGITGAVGLQGRVGNYMRFGITIKMPTFYEINEVFSQRFDATFDNGDYSYITFGGEDGGVGQNSYSVTTPFVYGGGFSVHWNGIVFAAGAEYIDVTQLEFSDALSKVIALNRQIAKDLTGQVKWGVGFEYDIPTIPVVVRSGFTQTSSPYSVSIDNAGLTELSFGGGVYIGKNVRLDAVVRLSDVSEQYTNYGSPDTPDTYAFYTLRKSPTSFALGVTYRY